MLFYLAQSTRGVSEGNGYLIKNFSTIMQLAVSN